jgi:Lrp/AsnC family transcriptional regulator, regulator for asnA, asnC and gidA
MEVKIDKRDRKILTMLAEKPRATYTELAEFISLSKNATKTRLDRLFTIGAIEKILPTINYTKLGYYSYDVFLKCAISGDKKKKFERHLKEHDNIIWACSVFGSYTYYFEIICKNAFAFDRMMSQIVTSLGDSFREYKTVLCTERIKIRPLVPELAEDIPIKYKAKLPKLDLTPIQLDNLDKKILYELSKDGRMSYFEIGKKLGVTLQTIRNRVKKMLKNTTIENFTPLYGYNKALGYTNYFVFLKVRYNNKKVEQKLRDYLKENKHTKLALRIANSNEILLFVSTRHPKYLEALVMELREKFPEMIRDVEFMHMLYEIKINFFPKGLFI